MDEWCLLGMVLLRPGRLPAGFGWLSGFECLGVSSPPGLPQVSVHDCMCMNRWQALCHVPYFFLLSPSILNGFIAFLWYLYLTLLLSSFLALSCGGSVTGFWFGFGVFCGGKFLFFLFFFLSHFTAVHLLWKIWKSKNAGYSGDCFLIPV